VSDAAVEAVVELVTPVGQIPPARAPAIGPRLVPDPQLAEGFLTPLEAALVAEIRGNGAAVVSALGELKTEIREVRTNPPFRWVPWSMLLLWLLNMFVIGILALERGVDPVRAAEAVKTLVPAVGTENRRLPPTSE
jgi:hypothetical protein